MGKFKCCDLHKTTKKILIFILVSLLIYACLALVYINTVYGNISDYFDIYLNPQKQSYNLFFASSIGKYDYKCYNKGEYTIYTIVTDEDKKHRGQKNQKSKIIVKYIDLFYDLYRAIGSADYYNIKPIKIEEEKNSINILAGDRLLESIMNLNLLTPKLETTNELKQILIEKNEALLAFKQKKKKDIKKVNIQFYDVNNQDNFFLGIEDLETRKLNANKKLRQCKEPNKTSTPKEVLEMLDCETDNSRNILYANAKALRKQYIIIATLKDGSELVYKIKALDGGNEQYWEIAEVDKVSEKLNDYIKSLMQKI